MNFDRSKYQKINLISRKKNAGKLSCASKKQMVAYPQAYRIKIGNKYVKLLIVYWSNEYSCTWFNMNVTGFHEVR